MDLEAAIFQFITVLVCGVMGGVSSASLIGDRGEFTMGEVMSVGRGEGGREGGREGGSIK